MAHQHDIAHASEQKTIKAYVIGYVGSMLLTLAAFGLLEVRLFSDAMTYVLLAALAIIQLYVQSSCFLSMNKSTAEGRLKLLPYLFTLLVIVILVTGTLWIMYNLDFNMTH